jgi:prepilin peptidase CpaA
MLGRQMSQGGTFQEPLTGLMNIPIDSQPQLYTAGFSSLPTAEAAILAVLAGIVTWAAISDLTSTRIPNTANAAILALWIGWAIVNPDAAPLYSFGIGIGLFIGGAVLFHFKLMGGGDVKFLAVLGLFAGPQQIFLFLICVSLFGGLLCILAILQSRQWITVPVITLATTTHGKRTVPYGVAIAASAYIMIASLWSI